MSEINTKQMKVSRGKTNNDTGVTPGYISLNTGIKKTKTVSDATYIATAEDINSIISMTNAGVKTFTLPQEIFEKFNIGYHTQVRRAGAGDLIIATQGSDKLLNAYNSNKLNDLNSIVSLTKISSNEYLGAGGFFDFDPFDIGNVEAMYDASTEDGVTLSGSNVEAWLDQSGNGRDALQGTTINQPTWSDTRLNNLGGIRFDGSNDFLAASFTVSQPLTYYWIGKYVSTAGASPVMFFPFASGANNGPRFFNLSSSWYAFAGTGLSGGTVDTNPHYFTVDYNGASGIIRIDGSSVATGNIGTTGTDGLTIGRNPNGSQYGYIDMYELWVFSKILTNTDRANMDTYSILKWGL